MEISGGGFPSRKQVAAPWSNCQGAEPSITGEREPEDAWAPPFPAGGKVFWQAKQRWHTRRAEPVLPQAPHPLCGRQCHLASVCFGRTPPPPHSERQQETPCCASESLRVPGSCSSVPLPAGLRPPDATERRCTACLRDMGWRFLECHQSS